MHVKCEHCVLLVECRVAREGHRPCGSEPEEVEGEGPEADPL